MTLEELLARKAQMPIPRTVVHCGSTRRAMDAFIKWRLKDTLAGMKVLTIGADKNDEKLVISEEQAINLDCLHLFKIDDADLVRVFNVGGYIGPSTFREVQYAIQVGKEIWWLEPDSWILSEVREEEKIRNETR